jgi:catechol 2,3-dioxygenase-like lactoylglutathione lyase family enzyme
VNDSGHPVARGSLTGIDTGDYTSRLTINLRVQHSTCSSSVNVPICETLIDSPQRGLQSEEGRMEHVVSDLVGRFERGRLSRRELVHALAMLAAAGTATPASAAPLRSGSINHVSVLVSDMTRSIDFYNRVFGLSLQNEDKANKISRLGISGKVLVSLRVEPPPGLVDHFAIGVEGFNREAVTKELQGMGLTPRENLQFGFHVKDPDGANVQITGI